MRIGIDARVLMDKYYSGVSEYAANLLEAILRVDKNNEYKLFYNSWRDLNGRLDIWQRNRVSLRGTKIPNKIFNYILQKIFHYPKLDKVLGGVDVFWLPHFNFANITPSPTGPKAVLTVHDLSFLRYPEFFSFRKNFWHKALNVKKIIREAEAIVAVSENTKNDLVELVGVQAEKVKVIYSGNNLCRREIGAEEVTRFYQNHGLNKIVDAEYILFLGNIEPRKNISALIEAYNYLRSQNETNVRFNNLKLYLAGAAGWKDHDIFRTWKKSPYQNDIKFLGYVSKEEKDILYSRASVFSYPSFYEGFGFPPLEAMTYGVPTVCANVSSLPEVVGGAALLINPFKPKEIAEALEMALNDEALRDYLIRAGQERAKLFSWDKAAAEYLALFRKIHEK